MILCTATIAPIDDAAAALRKATGNQLPMHIFSDSVHSVVEKYQASYEAFRGEDVLAYIHDDVTIHEPYWHQRVLGEFMDPEVAIVGFGGATAIGHPDIYKIPYDQSQLARRGYASNQTDFETHGERFTGSRDVATLDGFAMCIRTAFLNGIGGWEQVLKVTRFHNYDNVMCLLAHRHGWRVRMVGVSCTHHGGGTSTSPAYAAWCAAKGTDMAREHSEPHVRMYHEFRDLLPFEVKQNG